MNDSPQPREKAPAHLGYLLTAYLFKSLSAPGVKEVERHLKRCERCRNELETLRHTLGMVEKSFDSGGKEYVFEERRRRRVLETARQRRPAPQVRWITFSLGSIAAILMGGMLLFSTVVRRKSANETAAAETVAAASCKAFTEAEETYHRDAARETTVQSKEGDPALIDKTFGDGVPRDLISKDSPTNRVPPDILARAQLGDHFETINPEVADTHSTYGNTDTYSFHSVEGREEPAGGGGMNGKDFDDLLGVGDVNKGSGGGSFSQRSAGGRNFLIRKAEKVSQPEDTRKSKGLLTEDIDENKSLAASNKKIANTEGQPAPAATPKTGYVFTLKSPATADSEAVGNDGGAVYPVGGDQLFSDETKKQKIARIRAAEKSAEAKAKFGTFGREKIASLGDFQIRSGPASTLDTPRYYPSESEVNGTFYSRGSTVDQNLQSLSGLNPVPLDSVDFTSTPNAPNNPQDPETAFLKFMPSNLNVPPPGFVNGPQQGLGGTLSEGESAGNQDATQKLGSLYRNYPDTNQQTGQVPLDFPFPFSESSNNKLVTDANVKAKLDAAAANAANPTAPNITGGITGGYALVVPKGTNNSVAAPTNKENLGGLVAGGTIIIGDHLTDSARDSRRNPDGSISKPVPPGPDGILGTADDIVSDDLRKPLYSKNFTLSQMEIFNRDQWANMQQALPSAPDGSFSQQNSTFDPNFVPRYYVLNQGDPVTGFVNGSPSTNPTGESPAVAQPGAPTLLPGTGSYINGQATHLVNGANAGQPDNSMLVDSTDPTKSNDAARSAYNGTVTDGRNTSSFRIDGMLYTNNTIFGIQRDQAKAVPLPDSFTERLLRGFRYFKSQNARLSFGDFARRPAPVPPSALSDDGLDEDEYIERYGTRPFVDCARDHLSTFGLDVDTASYTLARSRLRQGQLPEPEAVRVEEFLNYFKQPYSVCGTDAFGVFAEGAPSPFAGVDVLKIGIKSRDPRPDERKPAMLTFCVDTSGSMTRDDRLELVRRALTELIMGLNPEDAVSIVGFSEQAELILPRTQARQKQRILDAIATLNSHGSTNVEAGLNMAYRMADESYAADAVNRVILCSDGVANVGAKGPDEMLKLVKIFAGRGIELSTVGFGMGSYNDKMMVRLADNGNGSCHFVDTLDEAKKVFTEQLPSHLNVLARDAKAQVDFNPDVVERYRLLGYEKRKIADKDFRNDAIDSGDVAHSTLITVIYELKCKPAAHGPLGKIYLRWKDAGYRHLPVVERNYPLSEGVLAGSIEKASPEFRFLLCVARFAELLRGSPWVRDSSYASVLDELNRLPPEFLARNDCREVLELIGLAQHLSVEKWSKEVGSQKAGR